MEQQVNINMERLYRLAKEGRSADEIMQELDIPDRATLKNAVINLMHEKGEEFQVPGLIDSAAIEPRFTEEGIRIDPEMLPGAEFKTGDSFKLTVEGDRITLEKKT